KTLAHIDAKRAALGLPAYDPKKFGRSGDWRVTELYERAEVAAEALYGGN
ncbi:MAG: Carbon monoxide dehydrogenase, partial [Anaerolineales bacterium]|nr:Carbon monoxide dehydrogenase [Anaerolineales bacterium]